MKSVVQEWLSNDNISLKQQSVVLFSLRGCDNVSKYDLSRKLTCQLRSAILYNAAKNNTDFMSNTMILEELREFAKDINKYPMHYYMHACEACEIIGYKHPDEKIREWFNGAYLIMVDTLNLKPETEEECDDRLKDGI